MDDERFRQEVVEALNDLRAVANDISHSLCQINERVGTLDAYVQGMSSDVEQIMKQVQ